MRKEASTVVVRWSKQQHPGG